MTKRTPSNLARSVQDRLRDRARREGRLHEDVLVRHALERFLYRLGRTRHREGFVLKGGLLLHVWTGLEARPTRDIDLLGPVGLGADGLREFVEDCLAADVSNDGWRFLGGSEIRVSPIREGSAYMGLRAVFIGMLGKSRVRMQVDVGEGDHVVPPPTSLILPTLLDQPAPEVMGYQPITTIAEKLDAILVLGTINSRVKDYFDIALLAQTLAFDGQVLQEAIRACCARRKTELPARLPIGLAPRFETDETANQHWQRFLKKLGREAPSRTWSETVVICRGFLQGPLEAAAAGYSWTKSWAPGGPWLVSGPG